MDYYSKFIEVERWRDTRSRTVIDTLKAQCGRHGIPALSLITFARDSIPHVRSSQHTPPSNCEIVKRLWHKATDKHLSILDYRTTPLELVGLSPAQLLMGRRPSNKLSMALELFAPTAYDPLKVKRLLYF